MSFAPKNAAAPLSQLVSSLLLATSFEELLENDLEVTKIWKIIGPNRPI